MEETSDVGPGHKPRFSVDLESLHVELCRLDRLNHLSFSSSFPFPFPILSGLGHD